MVGVRGFWLWVGSCVRERGAGKAGRQVWLAGWLTGSTGCKVGGHWAVGEGRCEGVLVGGFLRATSFLVALRVA